MSIHHSGPLADVCHTPAGMNLEAPIFMSNLDRHPTSREGITCISCHRVNKPYGKISGRQALVEGDIFDKVYGTRGNENLAETIESGTYNIQPERGQAVAAATRFALSPARKIC